MNVTRQLIITLLGTTLGAAAFAQEATPDTWMHTASSKSRDVVQQELRQARLDGTTITSDAYDFIGRTVSLKSRDQVRAELAASKASGDYTALNAEVASFNAPRMQLLAETRAK